jgi:tellurite resistance protein
MSDGVIVQLSRDVLPRLSAVLSDYIPEDSERFLAVLELGYLAASADGLDVAERHALANTLEQVTGIGFDGEAFEEHFADLDEAVAVLGRRERLARTVAEFETDETRSDAIRFAALVAMADGELHADELTVLGEAGGHFQWDEHRIRALVDEAAARVRDGGKS